MAHQRDRIRMSEAELQRFLEEERVATCATVGPGGRPHLMPLWYTLEGGAITGWTFAKSQKVRNLERNPQATLQVEAGRDVYAELRGAMLECDVEILRDPGSVESIGLALARRYGGLAPTRRCQRRAGRSSRGKWPSVSGSASGPRRS
jgi:PPOX class probable F420-dependent enzyme